MTTQEQDRLIGGLIVTAVATLAFAAGLYQAAFAGNVPAYTLGFALYALAVTTLWVGLGFIGRR